MTAGRVALAAGVLVALSGVALAAILLDARGLRPGAPESAAPPLYVRSGRAAGLLALSFDALAADLYWMRAIQHYGNERGLGPSRARFDRLQPFLDLATTLDPHFSIVYRFGAIFLSLDPPDGPGRPDLAIALLEKGLTVRPARWQYAHDIGFVHYWHTGRFDEAARWFGTAADMDGAPAWLRPLAAVTLAEGGDRRGARQLLAELIGTGEPYIRRAAARSLGQLDALDDLDRLQAVVEAFRRSVGRYPGGWLELDAAGAVDGLPIDPTGAPYIYSPDDHTVRVSPDSPLSPLPGSFRRR
jgi:tetratricopeptide (TPR) repeat protein